MALYSRAMRTALLALSILPLACGGDDTSSAADAAIDASNELPTSCTGDCAVFALSATFGGTTEEFDRAFFGLTSPGKSDSGDWELHIESYGGGDDACPTESSPAPDRTVVLARVPIPAGPGMTGEGQTSLLDFTGSLIPGVPPTSTATSHTIVWTAADPCIPCAEGTEADRQDRFVAFDLSATFAEGTALGHLYATHCDSLDDL